MQSLKPIVPEDRNRQGKRPSSGQAGSRGKQAGRKDRDRGRQGTQPASSRRTGGPQDRRQAPRQDGRSRGKQAASRPRKTQERGEGGHTLLYRFLALLVLILLFLIPSIIRANQSNQMLSQAREEKEALRSEKESLQSTLADLRSQLEEVNSDDFIEKYAHQKLGMVKPDEILVKMKDGSYKVDEKAVKDAQSAYEEYQGGGGNSDSTSSSSSSAEGSQETRPAETDSESQPEESLSSSGQDN